jgi:hypothetical protein
MFRVTWDSRAIEKDLSNYAKQQTFALQLALNRTQEERQVAVQDHVTTNLTIRANNTRNQFRRAVRFAREDRADRNKGKLDATLRIIGGNTSATTELFRRLGGMILRQDQGGTQTSTQLYRTQRNELTPGGFVLPAPGLRTATKGVPRKRYPVNIGLTTRRAIEGGNEFATQYKGGKKKRGGFKKGTQFYFVKENVGIFVRQQVGKASEYDAVWFFRTRINLPKRLDLDGTFQRGLSEQLLANYEGFLAFALRTAK